MYVWCSLNEEGIAEFHQLLVISAVINEGLCKPGIFQNWPRWDFSEDDEKEGKKKKNNPALI